MRVLSLINWKIRLQKDLTLRLDSTCKLHERWANYQMFDYWSYFFASFKTDFCLIFQFMVARREMLIDKEERERRLHEISNVPAHVLFIVSHCYRRTIAVLLSPPAELSAPSIPTRAALRKRIL